ncbi:MAG TPA: EamA family transporter, partial [Neisseria sp.]|nr:EamA family transporter [Neisseria sp.]
MALFPTRPAMTPARSSDGLTENQKGLLYALCCYLLWGLFPLYWYPLTHSGIDAGQLLAQRIVWSALFSVVLVAVFKQTHVLLDALRRPKTLLVFTCSATAIGLNWLIFLWAIGNNHVLEASLGYFISPLFSMLLGRLFFNEHFNRIQLAAIVLAAIGIFWLALPAGQVP